MKAKFLLLLILVMLGMCTTAHAEGNCPPGYVPSGVGPGGVQGCAPLPGTNSSGNTQQGGVWEDRYGAIATDNNAGLVGTSTRMSSRKMAEQSAIADCQNQGGTHCESRGWYRNGCGSMAAGDKDFAVSTAETLEDAKASSLKKCSSGGDMTCKIYYTNCVSPQRIK